MRIRGASLTDIPFLVDTIIAAEKSGTDRLGYSTIFELTDAEVRLALAAILEEDVQGQELCVSGFLIAEIESSSAAAVCSWVEGAGGRPSGVLKANLLMHFLGRERFLAAASRLRAVEALNLARTPGYLQLESVYVAPRFRGRRLFEQLLKSHCDDAAARNPALVAAEIILMKDNTAALRTYQATGFVVAAERYSSDPSLLGLLPANRKVSMVKWLNSAQSFQETPIAKF